jgi:hypothetical protein
MTRVRSRALSCQACRKPFTVKVGTIFEAQFPQKSPRANRTPSGARTARKALRSARSLRAQSSVRDAIRDEHKSRTKRGLVVAELPWTGPSPCAHLDGPGAAQPTSKPRRGSELSTFPSRVPPSRASWRRAFADPAERDVLFRPWRAKARQKPTRHIMLDAMSELSHIAEIASLDIPSPDPESSLTT